MENFYHNPGITQRTLSNNLRQLLDDGMLIKKCIPKFHRTEYSLLNWRRIHSG
ncbi:MAG: winged helix-turn-helix transcriptional regulator [[Clostridium] scindens]